MGSSHRNERGTILILMALLLLVMLGFLALGTEAGRWYLVRAELSKSVDAAALAGARNLANPYVDPTVLAREFGVENFPAGAHGSGTDGGAASFSAQLIDTDRLTVSGQASAIPVLPKIVGFDAVAVSSGAQAQKREAEIMMILDRSGSMGMSAPGGHTAISDLRTAAKSFVGFFAATQDRDKVGMVSFSTTARLDRALGTNFVSSMTTAINAMQAEGYTDTEDAVDMADGNGGFTDQTGLPGERHVQQFAVFFSDGMPTAFHDQFMVNGVTYNAIVRASTNFVGGCAGFGDNMRLVNALNGQELSVVAVPTGDGKPLAMSACGRTTTRWYAFDSYPVPGYAPTACSIPATALDNYFCTEAKRRAVAHAAELKAKGVVVFVIGLGNVDKTFLGQVATSSQFVYYTPDSSQLQSLFQQVAQQIQLRLVM